MTEPQPPLRSLARDVPPAAWPERLAAAGYPPYRGRQLSHWLWEQGALAWERMTSLPGSLREELAAEHDLQGLTPVERQMSRDGTRKFLFRLRDGHLVESVIIPMDRHATFCISSQVGCAMACRFCATARGGLARDLTPGEIVEQVLYLREDLAAEPLPDHGDRQFNVVFMGMGEPLENWEAVGAAVAAMIEPEGLGMSARRIQISTSGPAAGLRDLLGCPYPVGLTLSLGGSTDEERKRVMPVAGRTSLAESTRLAAAYASRSHRTVTLAYVLIAGVSDGLDQAARLAALARGRPFKVNLIPLNRLDGDKLEPAALERVLAFQRVLADAEVAAYVRLSGGQDIDAACGQLRRRRQFGEAPARSTAEKLPGTLPGT
ncbi:MAG: 23S rRNA (adenine(2503)-C(2))-methyltransferase RlmN [Candidatus Krumholzibacteriia bacterium]